MVKVIFKRMWFQFGFLFKILFEFVAILHDDLEVLDLGRLDSVSFRPIYLYI